MKNNYKFSLLIALFAIFSVTLSAQRVVVVDGYEPGVSSGTLEDFNNALIDAIDADSTERKTNPDVIYELKRNNLYPMGGIINNYGYKLHIRGQGGDGLLPELVSGKTVDGAYNGAYIRSREDFTFENVQVNGFKPDGSYANRSVRHQGVNTRVIYNNIVIYADRGAGIAFLSDSIKAYLNDFVVQNTGHHYVVGGNGRFIGLRNDFMDTLIIRNSTVTNASDRVIRNMGTEVNYLEIDHMTAYNNAGLHGSVQLGFSHTAKVTNSIFANTISLGHEDDRVNEQTQPEKHFSIISLDTTFAGQVLEIRNNNIYTDQAIKDVWAKYDSVEAPYILTATIETALGNAASDAYIEEPLTFASSCGTLEAFVDTYYATPVATELPENWCIGGEGEIGLFPDQVDLSYGTDATSYTAGDNGYPLGNLNYFPDLKARWEGKVTKPIVNDEFINYCINETTRPLEAESFTGEGTLLWYSASGISGSETAPTPSSANPGLTKYYVTEMNDGVESDSTEISVIVYEPELLVEDQVSRCGDQTTLTANFSNYRGYEDISYSWSFDDKTISGNNRNVIFEEPTVVTAFATTPSGCSTTASLSVNLTKLNQTIDIKTVSVNSLNGKNIVSWNPVDNSAIDSIYVLRAESLSMGASEVETIASMDYSMQFDRIEDPIVYENPADYKYTVLTKDICGFTSDFTGNFDRGIGLITFMLSNESNALQWNSYKGRDVVDYQLLRGTNPDNLIVIFDEPDQFSYFDIGASQNLYYQVRANLTPLYSNPDDNIVLSNILEVEPANSIFDTVTVYDTITVYETKYISVTDTLIINLNQTSINDLDYTLVKMYPNPAKDYLKIDIQVKTDTWNYQVKIVNSNGETVYYNMLNQQNYSIKLDDLGSRGLYFVQIINDSGNIIDTRKIIIE